MLQLTNFIPKAAAECRSLLKTLGEKPDGLSLSDRYGGRESLTADDVKALIGLIEKQIGEKAPETTSAETPDKSPKTQGKTLKTKKKNNLTSIKNEDK